MTSQPTQLNYQRIRRAVLLFGLVFSLVVVMVTGLTIWKDRRQTEADHRRNAANLTRLFIEQTDQLFTSLERSLDQVERKIAQDPELLRGTNSYWLDGLRPSVRGFAFLFVLRPDGRMWFSGDREGLVESNWAPMPSSLKESSSRLSVGALGRSRKNETTVVPLLRPFRSADGTLKGWLGVALNAQYLLNYMAELDDGNFRINLRLLDGGVILRYPHREDLIGRDLRPQKVFELAQKNAHGQYIDLSPVEFDLAFYDYRVSSRFPYFVVVVRNVERMFGDWRHSAGILIFVAVLVLVAVAVLVWAVRSQIARVEREDQRLREVEAQVRQSSRLQAIGRISSGLARDFNALLVIMFGQTEWLERRVESGSPAHLTLDKTRRTLGRARDLVRQVLALQKTELRVKQELSLLDIAKELETFMKNALPEGLRFELSASDPGMIMGDPNQIYQALLNLCANGLDAMRDGGGLLQIRIRRNSQNQIVLEVEDEGHGIPANDLEKIFEPFYTTKAQGEGTGMGLSLVSSMAHENGVLIEVLSRVGMGTTFKLIWVESGRSVGEEEQHA